MPRWPCCRSAFDDGRIFTGRWKSVLATDPSHFRIFDQAFHIYFRNLRLLEKMISLMLPSIERDAGSAQTEPAVRRLVEALDHAAASPRDDDILDIDRSASYSRREILRTKDFEQMSLEELAQARRLLRHDVLEVPMLTTRRFRAHPHGSRYDMRRSMRLMLRNNGQLIELARRKRRRRESPLVLICDISGSMSSYSRMFLQFAHTLRRHSTGVSCFVFGTRLSNIGRRLQEPDIDKALAGVADDVVDWDGGTRIAESIARFNIDWGRRVLAQGSVVVLLSDGLERETSVDLGFQMQRLQRSCRQLIWMNPMLRYDQFEAKAAGIRAMLPYVRSLSCPRTTSTACWRSPRHSARVRALIHESPHDARSAVAMLRAMARRPPANGACDGVRNRRVHLQQGGRADAD